MSSRSPLKSRPIILDPDEFVYTGTQRKTDISSIRISTIKVKPIRSIRETPHRTNRSSKSTAKEAKEERN
jgi:hypothetical protein